MVGAAARQLCVKGEVLTLGRMSGQGWGVVVALWLGPRSPTRSRLPLAAALRRVSCCAASTRSHHGRARSSLAHSAYRPAAPAVPRRTCTIMRACRLGRTRSTRSAPASSPAAWPSAAPTAPRASCKSALAADAAAAAAGHSACAAPDALQLRVRLRLGLLLPGVACPAPCLPSTSGVVSCQTNSILLSAHHPPRFASLVLWCSYVAFMTTPGSHNDTYAESYHRDFFRRAPGMPGCCLLLRCPLPGPALHSGGLGDGAAACQPAKAVSGVLPAGWLLGIQPQQGQQAATRCGRRPAAWCIAGPGSNRSHSVFVRPAAGTGLRVSPLRSAAAAR